MTCGKNVGLLAPSTPSSCLLPFSTLMMFLCLFVFSTLALTALYFGLFCTIWTQYWTMNPFLWRLLWCCTCYFSFVGAVAVHNTIHCPVFYDKLANKIFQVVLTLTYGHPVSNYVPGHNLSHHQHTQRRKDVMRTSKVQYKWHLLNGVPA